LIEIELEKLDDAVAHLGEAWQRLLEIGQADGIAQVGEVYAQTMSREDAVPVVRRSAEAYRSLGCETDAQRVEAALQFLPARTPRFNSSPVPPSRNVYP
jgi:hypothetical protein